MYFKKKTREILFLDILLKKAQKVQMYILIVSV